ncbi:MAG: sulfite exporter TauE/SafE family protein [Bacteroidota bacterium]
MEFQHLLIAGIAALAAGFVNAVAGGGTLITFPVLIALGVSPVSANVTNTIALCPGFFGGTFAQRHDIASLKERFLVLMPFGIAGGIAGGLLLLHTTESSFRVLIPYLILFASILLAVQSQLKKIITRKNRSAVPSFIHKAGTFLLIFLASVYGGYFGAGLGVMLIAVLGLVYNDNINKLNALKQALSLCINLTAAVYFAFSGKAQWSFVIVMAAGALAGGTIGGKLARKMNPGIFRWLIVCTGIIVSLFYFFK